MEIIVAEILSCVSSFEETPAFADLDAIYIR